MAANLMTPSLRTARRNRAQFVPFLPGVHSQNFAEVSKILEALKRYYGIVGDVPVILAEDETMIKPHVRLSIDAEITEALKKGLEQAQSLLIQLNMAPHIGVRNQVWWKTPWITERELGLFERSVEESPESLESERDDGDAELADLNTIEDLWGLSSPKCHVKVQNQSWMTMVLMT
ncbi:hypothetical protein R1sor_024053 [Riccia sorocarpa]|uniref:Uncharacterized protein n=1 Tax=Riccia sorocarpa TaxID=122646 RepID=A0ABD3GSE6_9MARC